MFKTARNPVTMGYRRRGQDMATFVMDVVICTLVILLVCYILRHIVKFPVYIIPVFSAVCSVVLLFSSFFKGEWGGMGLGAIGLVLLLASVLPFMLSALFF
ncbi:hypothetical protein HMPREF3213_02977 [Heyndrickxia coagulans]|uniref:Uncharacterized protein n=1 Tax=Heyndrickxia coagulans TaxID=1398 RepID=A0A133KGD6_HEYCO|nr:hypothetical protein HMPREF3213_02977 [Heyndrickxia coagulans]